MKLQNDVRQFMLTARQPLPDFPTVPTLEIRVLRAKLILEEAFEQCDAMGVQIAYGASQLDGHQFEYAQGESPDLARVADGVVDQIYVSLGAALAHGINLDRIWDLVQAANMAKFGPGSYARPDGKQMKPPGWIAPDADIHADIKRQSKEGNGL